MAEFIVGPRHVQLTAAQQTGRRVVIVGDIHGCCDEFVDLLEQHTRPSDTIILAGDLVNKGPKSAEVVRTARARKCLGIVGNHEWAVLRARAAREGGRFPEKETFYAW
jgi:predicted phosphodiesterase